MRGVKTKKGSHIGTVISFVLFITFIVFLYSITSPALKSNKEEENLLIYLENKIIENVSAELNSTSISFENSGDCLQINNYQGGANTVVKDKDGNIVDSGVEGNTLFIKISSETFFKIYSSEVELEGKPYNSGDCANPLTNYEPGLSRTEKKVSEEKVIELINRYSANYSKLKEDFKIPNSRDFGFGFIYNNGTLIPYETPEKNASSDIYTNRVPVEYFDKQAEILQGFVNIKVW